MDKKDSSLPQNIDASPVATDRRDEQEANKKMKSLISQLADDTTKTTKKVPRIAFIDSPRRSKNNSDLYKRKTSTLPNATIKRIRVQNFLIAAVLKVKGSQVFLMGNEKKNRFDIGFKFKIKEEYKKYLNIEQTERVNERIRKVKDVLLNCGRNANIEDDDRMTFAEFLSLQVQNGFSFGYFNTEFIYSDDSNRVLNRFRPVDAGTIYKIKDKDSKKDAETIRETSLQEIYDNTGVKIDDGILNKDKYKWVQVIDGKKQQVFTGDEMVMTTLIGDTTDVEHSYPIPPMDNVVGVITTLESIGTYNKLYFMNGRGSKGILAINSDSLDQGNLEHIKQVYNASINSLDNSFRVPVFGIGEKDKLQWIPTNANKKDGEFEYLYDQNIRAILSAFMVSPEEISGFSYLSRGTSNKSLAESNQEYALTVRRDGSLKTTIIRLDHFINNVLLPKLDPDLAKVAYIEFGRIEIMSREEENQQLNAEVRLHYTYDELLEDVEKDKVGEMYGGSLPMSDTYQNAVSGFSTVGELTSRFYGLSGAELDPILNYRRDAFYFQHIQMLQTVNPRAVQALFVAKPNGLEMLKWLIEEEIEEDEVD